MLLPLPLSMWILGGLTATAGYLLFQNNPRFMGWLQSMPRSQRWAAILFGTGLTWFLWHVLNLGQADFGNYRHWLFALFLACGLGAFRYLPDFLAVRGLAMLVLLVANVFLQSAYLQEPIARLTLVSWTYILIIAAIIVGASPYRFHRWIQRLTLGHQRRQVTGVAFLLIGTILCLSAFGCLGTN